MGWGEPFAARVSKSDRARWIRKGEARGRAKERARIADWLRDVCECPASMEPHELADLLDAPGRDVLAGRPDR